MPNIADDFQKLISSSFSEDISLVQFSVVLRHVLTDRDRQTNARQSITFLAEVENRCSLEPHITRSFAYRTGWKKIMNKLHQYRLKVIIVFVFVLNFTLVELIIFLAETNYIYNSSIKSNQFTKSQSLPIGIFMFKYSMQNRILICCSTKYADEKNTGL